MATKQRNSYENFAEKYRIKDFKDILGQNEAVVAIKQFLVEFPKKRGLILHGPAGTGKTSLVYAAANELKAELFELNASDLRNRAKLEEVLKPATIQQSLFKRTKILLMDEVDGVTGTDIGGIPELIRILQETKYPIIMTCNDVWQTKLAPLRQVCKVVELKALPFNLITDILTKVAILEGIKKTPEELYKIALKSQGDVRAALNDLQSYSKTQEVLIDPNEKRDTEETIFMILRKLFKEREPFLNLFDNTKLSLDEILLWIEENIPREYKNEALAKAYYALGNADIFRGRIYKNQSWRFLVYQNIFQSAGVSFAKEKPLEGFTKYESPKRIYKIWAANQRLEKKKSIAKKLARFTHCSTKRALQEFVFLKKVLKNQEIYKKLKLSEEEIAFLEQNVESNLSL